MFFKDNKTEGIQRNTLYCVVNKVSPSRDEDFLVENVEWQYAEGVDVLAVSRDRVVVEPALGELGEDIVHGLRDRDVGVREHEGLVARNGETVPNERAKIEKK